jgi:hypothetical protein
VASIACEDATSSASCLAVEEVESTARVTDVDSATITSCVCTCWCCRNCVCAEESCEESFSTVVVDDSRIAASCTLCDSLRLDRACVRNDDRNVCDSRFDRLCCVCSHTITARIARSRIAAKTSNEIASVAVDSIGELLQCFGDELDRGVLRLDRGGQGLFELGVLLGERLDGSLVNLGGNDLHLIHEVAEADGAEVDHPEVGDAGRTQVDEIGVPGAADAVPGQCVGALDARERADLQVLGVELVHAPSRASYSSEREPR